MNTPPVCNYEGSDYQSSFWDKGGREYEDRTEAIALRVISMPFIHTSQPSPHAPSVGFSQLSSTKRMSFFFVSIPSAVSEPRYNSRMSGGDGFSTTWYW